jgi:hypothetical protein
MTRLVALLPLVAALNSAQDKRPAAVLLLHRL